MEKLTSVSKNSSSAVPALPDEYLDAKRLSDALLKGVVADDTHPLALLFECGDTRLEITRGFAGDGKGGQGEAVTFDTRFRLASVTKQLIARGVVELALAGKLCFEDTLDTYFQGLPAAFSGLTLRMLLNHTSGIPDYEDMPDDHTGRQVVDEDVPGYLKTLDSTYFTPGSRYRYSNTAFVLLGMVIAKASGKTLSDAMKELVFTPAGMNKTLVNVEGETAIPSRAYGHIVKDGKVIEKDQYRWSATVGDGGIYSCVSDLFLWIDDMIANDGRLSGSMLLDPILPDGTHTGYGMGIRLKNVCGHRINCHTGETIGFNSALMYAPELPLRLVFLTNRAVREPFDVINNALSLVFGGKQTLGK